MAESMNCEERGEKNTFLSTVRRTKSRLACGRFVIIIATRVARCSHNAIQFTPTKNTTAKCCRQKKIPKVECPNCGKMLAKQTVYIHRKNGRPKPRKATKYLAVE